MSVAGSILCGREQVPFAQSKMLYAPKTLHWQPCNDAKQCVCVIVGVGLFLSVCLHNIFRQHIYMCFCTCKTLARRHFCPPKHMHFCMQRFRTYVSPWFHIIIVSFGVMLVNRLHCQTRPLHGPWQKEKKEKKKRWRDREEERSEERKRWWENYINSVNYHGAKFCTCQYLTVRLPCGDEPHIISSHQTSEAGGRLSAKTDKQVDYGFLFTVYQ